MKYLILTLFAACAFTSTNACSITAATTPNFQPLNNELLRYTFSPLGSSVSGAPATPSYKFWYSFGDGGTSLSTSPTHNYAAPGTYNVKFAMSIYDSSTQALLCTDTATQSLVVNYTSCATSFTYTNVGNTYTFTAVNPAGTPNMNYTWNFGDGSYSSANPAVHTYSFVTNYTVTLSAIDSAGSMCYYTNQQTIDTNIINPTNKISGYLLTSSSIITNPDYKVWLIKYDSTTQILSAVDSLSIASGGNMQYYEFLNKAAGTYRVKAAVTNGPTSGSGYQPTYHDSFLYWNTAKLVNHMGGNTSAKDVMFLYGTVVPGPGFIGGNVTLGANKGTGGGVAGQQMFLLNSSNMVVSSTYTDANGNYSFSNIALGAYAVRPEAGGYISTQRSVLTNTSQQHVSSVNFERNEVSKTIVPITNGIDNIHSKMFTLYPNPVTSGVISISWNDVKAKNAVVTITDVTGRKVLAQTVSTDNTSTLNVASLNAGTYNLLIQVGGQRIVDQLVITK